MSPPDRASPVGMWVCCGVWVWQVALSTPVKCSGETHWRFTKQAKAAAYAQASGGEVVGVSLRLLFRLQCASDQTLNG